MRLLLFLFISELLTGCATSKFSQEPINFKKIGNDELAGLEKSIKHDSSMYFITKNAELWVFDQKNQKMSLLEDSLTPYSFSEVDSTSRFKLIDWLVTPEGDVYYWTILCCGSIDSWYKKDQLWHIRANKAPKLILEQDSNTENTFSQMLIWNEKILLTFKQNSRVNRKKSYVALTWQKGDDILKTLNVDTPKGRLELQSDILKFKNRFFFLAEIDEDTGLWSLDGSEEAKQISILSKPDSTDHSPRRREPLLIVKDELLYTGYLRDLVWQWDGTAPPKQVEDFRYIKNAKRYKNGWIYAELNYATRGYFKPSIYQVDSEGKHHLLYTTEGGSGHFITKTFIGDQVLLQPNDRSGSVPILILKDDFRLDTLKKIGGVDLFPIDLDVPKYSCEIVQLDENALISYYRKGNYYENQDTQWKSIHFWNGRDNPVRLKQLEKIGLSGLSVLAVVKEGESWIVRTRFKNRKGKTFLLTLNNGK